MPDCSACGKTLDRSAFSKNQLSRGSNKRRCKVCAAKNAADLAAAAESLGRVRTLLEGDQSVSSLTDPARAAELVAAMGRPARRTAPLGYGTAEEAEADGWEWHSRRGVWIDGRKKDDPGLREEEHDLEANYSRESLDRLGTAALRAELEGLRAALPHSVHNSRTDHVERGSLIDEIVNLASEKHVILRDQRRQKAGAESAHTSTACRKCSKLPEAGKKLLRCSRCKMVEYCSKDCQRSHWPEHRAACRRQVEEYARLEREGVNTSGIEAAQREIMRWYAQVPKLAEDCAALAWKLRSESPVLVVEGGTNARVAQITILTEAMWRGAGQAELWEPRFASTSFDRDRHYFAMICRDRARDDLPLMTPRFHFPLPPDEMGEFVAENDADKRRRRQTTDAAAGRPRPPPTPPPAPAPSAPSSGATARSTAAVGRRKRLGHAWKCDACNASQTPDAECTWYDAHPQLGDFAICESCTRKGVTVDTVAEKYGCPVQ